MTSQGDTSGRPATPPQGKKRPWRKLFIEALAVSGNVRVAAQHAGITRSRAYQVRRGDSKAAAKFRADWDEALDNAADLLEQEARRRAVTGTDKPIYYKGALVDTVKEYSDQLLTLLLKAHRPERFRERFEHTGRIDVRTLVDIARERSAASSPPDSGE